MNSEDRFSFEHIGNTPFRDIKKRIIQIKQEKNILALTEARSLMATYNINRDNKKSSPYTDISDFLPFPSVWHLFNNTIPIPPQAAQEFLAYYAHLSMDIRLLFEPEIEIIRMIATR